VTKIRSPRGLTASALASSSLLPGPLYRVIHGTTSGADYATVAYNAATGARLWVQRSKGSGHSEFPYAASVAVSPDGGRVYVTGSRDGGSATGLDYATVAYNAGSGARLWVARYNGPASRTDTPNSMAVSPAGRKVYVTGYSDGATSRADYATIAYNAATGARLWVKRYNGPANGYDSANSVVVSPAGKVYVTGASRGTGPNVENVDYATVAYSATGTRLWVKRYNGPGNDADFATALAAPGNGKVYVTGQSGGGSTTGPDYATIAYDAVTGAQQWVRRYNGPGNGYDSAHSLAARSGRVFVTGLSRGMTSVLDNATVAYNG
jgi:DNA-binding beta-propeller fold protein YncE